MSPFITTSKAGASAWFVAPAGNCQAVKRPSPLAIRRPCQAKRPAVPLGSRSTTPAAQLALVEEIAAAPPSPSSPSSQTMATRLLSDCGHEAASVQLDRRQVGAGQGEDGRVVARPRRRVAHADRAAAAGRHADLAGAVDDRELPAGDRDLAAQRLGALVEQEAAARQLLAGTDRAEVQLCDVEAPQSQLVHRHAVHVDGVRGLAVELEARVVGAHRLRREGDQAAEGVTGREGPGSGRRPGVVRILAADRVGDRGDAGIRDHPVADDRRTDG